LFCTEFFPAQPAQANAMLNHLGPGFLVHNPNFFSLESIITIRRKNMLENDHCYVSHRV